MRSLSAVYSLLRPKSLCLWGYLQRRDSDAYKCVYVIVQSRQKRKRALLSNRKRRHTHIGLLFDFQRLKIGCFKTAVLKNAWPYYRCSLSFRNELLVLSWLVVLSLLHAPWWAAYKDHCDLYTPPTTGREQSVNNRVNKRVNNHSNYEKVLPETMYFATPRYKR